MGLNARLPFELDGKVDDGLITAHAGAPLITEMFRASGAAQVADEKVSIKKRRRGLSASPMLESCLTLWGVGGEHSEDFDRLRQDKALEGLLGHELPAAQTVRDFLEAFHDKKARAIWSGGVAFVHEESAPLAGLHEVLKRTVRHVQERRPLAEATLDVDAKVFSCDKKSAQWAYTGERGYQPVGVLRAEQDRVVADEFRDGTVPAGSGNARVIRKAIEGLPNFVSELNLRGDSALYEIEVLQECEKRGVRYAISADMSPGLLAEIRRMDESEWKLEADEGDAWKQWAEVAYVPTEIGPVTKNDVPMRRYLAVRILKKQGSLFADGSDRRHFAVVTNREGDGLEILKWHRLKAGTIEHTHDVVANDLGASALPSQKFGTNAAWFRTNLILYNILSALKSLALPGEYANARPKRLRFLLLNTVGRVISHARELLIRVVNEAVRILFDSVRLQIHIRAA